MTKTTIIRVCKRYVEQVFKEKYLIGNRPLTELYRIENRKLFTKLT